ncbi:hypothetical protein DMN91_010634 [Ooceraea biroi]|uniref:Actin-related protein 8 n=1 Tax=Ooceraea biroi TaxID=2015173 RepID=A0A026WIR6_OOCBI|nr:actin-related protein 8 [Ooceraea biroi]EZA55915.1 Actin-related protein [Ooceraea biroi]RLU16566.1 hypothetical protein DMN91_010634 [Ooceraea biroi]
MPVYQEAEQIQAQTIIVIHPGSMYLRMGRASDLKPVTLLHAVARRRLPSGTRYKDSFLPPAVTLTKELTQAMEESRLQVSHTLQSCLQSDGSRRYATPPQQIAAFNRRSSPEITSPDGMKWTKADRDVIIGDDILSLVPEEEAGFNIHFPYKRGELNVHSAPGGSLTAVMADLKTIWEYVLTEKLDIPLRDLKHYRAVLVIPDIYHRPYLKELTTLLLDEIGFGRCILLQDHVGAMFGAGLGYACIVDVGAQKISVSCVEDAISHKDTRVRMDYGGADVTQTFHWLLQKSAFPYKSCVPTNKLDALLLDQLKIDFCHVDLNVCGSQEKTFVVRKLKQTESYTLQVGDECLIAPLSLFQPELFRITGTHSVHGQKRSAGDPEDPYDENYLRETSRRGMKESLDHSSEMQEEAASAPAAAGEDEVVVDTVGDSVPSLSNRDLEAPRDSMVPQQLLGLDQAILQSIERCSNEDLKRKMYSCVLVVGSGLKFKGIGTWLRNRISLQTPYMYRPEQLDIITQPKDMDPGMTTWKGAGILSCLESAQELWIARSEWHRSGVRILRERSPFLW